MNSNVDIIPRYFYKFDQDRNLDQIHENLQIILVLKMIGEMFNFLHIYIIYNLFIFGNFSLELRSWAKLNISYFQ